ncbi:Reverse transcriptase (RNA-dependent DNA polymerase) [Nesidiocoris tenuis]|uniref:Reverse transcriptase (RNA-dependent DNA polymerase) n=1 Tax=Nesidiocoris tenuis TaxID=355587 RepID=A0ABN7ABW7_9HEMI|nr:Reverse transcriptase (RNA-dependent DNA polymerase) [Nesidiocoris tenuis]
MRLLIVFRDTSVSDVPTSPTTVSAMFADDEAILSRDRDGLVATTGLQKHLDEIALWSKKWRLVMNSSKSFNVIFTYRRNHVVSPLSLDGAIIPTMDAVRYLGITLDRRLTFRSHITDLVKRIRQRTRMLLPLLGRRSTLGMPMKRLLYLMLIRPIWQYGCSIWGASCATQIRRIQAQQNRVLRLITDAPWFVRSSILHRDLDIQMVQEVIQSTSTRTHQTMTNHPNPVFVDYEDLLESSRGDRRLKKKRPVDLL